MQFVWTILKCFRNRFHDVLSMTRYICMTSMAEDLQKNKRLVVEPNMNHSANCFDRGDKRAKMWMPDWEFCNGLLNFQSLQRAACIQTLQEHFPPRFSRSWKIRSSFHSVQRPVVQPLWHEVHDAPWKFLCRCGTTLAIPNHYFSKCFSYSQNYQQHLKCILSILPLFLTLEVSPCFKALIESTATTWAKN